MKLVLTKSNFFAAAFFGCAMLWFGAHQTVQATAGAQAWADLPGLMMLAVLVTGLLAIAFNFIWLKVLEHRGKSAEESENYWPAPRVLGKVVLAFLAAVLFGFVQGYLMP